MFLYNTRVEGGYLPTCVYTYHDILCGSNYSRIIKLVQLYEQIISAVIILTHSNRIYLSS